MVSICLLHFASLLVLLTKSSNFMNELDTSSNKFRFIKKNGMVITIS